MKYKKGFSLVELMIAVAIVGILSTVALPAYDSYMKKSRRSDAVSALLNLQMAQERWRATHPSYTGTIGSGGLGMSATSEQGYYDLSIVSAGANSFVISANPVSGGPQAGDACTSTHFRITQDGPLLTDSQKKQCWSR